MTTEAASRENTVSSGTAKASNADRFVVLDGLRGLAAFAVILDHVPSGALGAFLPSRTLSVDFFFILSGFVLAHAYGQRLVGGLSAWRFMRMRIIRLYPLYLAGLVLGCMGLLAPALSGQQWMGWTLFFTWVLPAVLFLPTPPNDATGGNLYPVNGPAWSLLFELIANTIYALTARFLSWRVFVVILPIGAVVTTLTIFHHSAVRGPGWEWGHFDAGLARVLFNFFSGVALYKLHSSTKLPAAPWWLAGASFLAIVAVPANSDWAPIYDAFATIVLIPILVAISCRSRVNDGVAQAFSVLGMLSYGVYVLHVPIYRLMDGLLPKMGITLGSNAISAISVAIVASVAAAVLTPLFDKPMRLWLAGMFPGNAIR